MNRKQKLRTRLATKMHTCKHCGEPIENGELHYHNGGRIRMHAECVPKETKSNRWWYEDLWWYGYNY